MKIKLIANRKVRLDKYISDNSDLSREQINKIIEQKNCLVDGSPAIKKSQIIDIDNTIIIDTRDNIEKNNDLILNYEYIDEDIIVLNKQKNIEAVCISSYNKVNDSVDARMVNLKYINDTEWIFFSNYNSKKAKQFIENSSISGLFFWNEVFSINI